MLDWVGRAGFDEPRVVDTNKTTHAEQRSTPWMPQYSLAEALVSNDDTMTVEGHPAPERSVLVAKKPELKR